MHISDLLISKNPKHKNFEIFLSRELAFSDEKKFLLKHFVTYAKRALRLQGPCKILIVASRHEYGISTTAKYSPDLEAICVYGKGRSLVDIMRSIAHELVHEKQHESGQDLVSYPLHFGNRLEKQANKLAGEILNAYTDVMGHDLVYENS